VRRAIRHSLLDAFARQIDQQYINHRIRDDCREQTKELKSIQAAREEPKVCRLSAGGLEGDGFEPSVPRKRDLLFKSAHQMAARGAQRAL
jgi:hypothetical protein